MQNHATASMVGIYPMMINEIRILEESIMYKNSVVAILEDYCNWEKLKNEVNYDMLSQKEKDKMRLKYDKDAKYYIDLGLSEEKALYADTIISFWTIYKTLLNLEAGWNASKTEKSLSALLYQIKKSKSDFSVKIRNVNEKIMPFAEICYTKGNFMLLPDRSMQRRYRVTEDRLDWTLYECFRDGELSMFFKSEQDLKLWIKEQYLESVFINGKIDKNNIKWFVQSEMPKKISKMNSNEIYSYLESAIEFIKLRD